MKNHTVLFALIGIVLAAMTACDIPTLNYNLREPEVPVIPPTETSRVIAGEVKSLNVASGAGMARLTWTDPEDEDFDHIEITCTEPPDGFAPQTVKRNKEMAEVSGLENGVSYGILLQLADADGNKSVGVHKSVVLSAGAAAIPNEVTDLMAASGAGVIHLTWTDPADDDIDYIEISCTEPVDGFPPVTVKKNLQEAKISGLETGVPYCILVQTVNKGGNKSAGVHKIVVISSDTAIPDEVTDLIATPGVGVIHLTWTDPAGDDFAHIEISCIEPVDGFARVPVAKNLQAADKSGLETSTV
jgi:predicted phage tail protein